MRCLYAERILTIISSIFHSPKAGMSEADSDAIQRLAVEKMLTSVMARKEN